MTELDPHSFLGSLISPRETLGTSYATNLPNVPEIIFDMSSYVNCYSNASNFLLNSVIYQGRNIVKIELR